MENYNLNKNSSNSSFGEPKSMIPKSKKNISSSSTGTSSSSGMDSRWWLWYLKNQMQGDGGKEKASS